MNLLYEFWHTVETRYITRSLGQSHRAILFVISVVNKQYKTKQINSLGWEKIVRYHFGI